MALVLATAQTCISPDVRRNGAGIRSMLHIAAQAGARLVHFPEAALSGYVIEQIGGWAEVDWTALQEELEAVASLARQLGVWAVLGCNQRLAAPAQAGCRAAEADGQDAPWPQNSLLVISDTGAIAGRYSKRKLSNTELTWWYTPGRDPLMFEVDGIRLGCALCIEVVFPELFAEYERLQADCVLLSMYSADARYGMMARAHAATNCVWISLSSPVAASGANPSCMFGPDGAVLGACPPAAPGLVVQAINRDDPRYWIPLHYARPWRAQAVSGALYAGRTA